MSQSAAYRDDVMLRRIRATAAIRRGTRMTKVLSPAQVAGHLGGRLPYGFCYRSCDIAHLHDPRELTLLATDGAAEAAEVAYALRWRAVDPLDYEVPAGPAQPGLALLPAHSRVGAMVLGTGFSPSTDDLIPEYITAGFADLPIPANAQIIAYVSGGEEILLYSYQPEQHGWLRLAGPRWRPLLDNLPGVSPDREYVPCTTPGSSTIRRATASNISSPSRASLARLASKRTGPNKRISSPASTGVSRTGTLTTFGSFPCQSVPLPPDA